jgi:hypothetical protein
MNSLSLTSRLLDPELRTLLLRYAALDPSSTRRARRAIQTRPQITLLFRAKLTLVKSRIWAYPAAFHEAKSALHGAKKKGLCSLFFRSSSASP